MVEALGEVLVLLNREGGRKRGEKEAEGEGGGVGIRAVAGETNFQRQADKKVEQKENDMYNQIKRTSNQ